MNNICMPVSNLLYFETMLQFLPKKKFSNIENFFIVYDDRKNYQIKQNIIDIINKYDNVNIKKAILISALSIIKSQKFIDEKGISFVFDYGPSIKLLIFDYLYDKYKVIDCLLIDDDVFVLGDIGILFNDNYRFKKDGLFSLKENNSKDKLLFEKFEEIFNTGKSFKDCNEFKINSGTIINHYDKNLSLRTKVIEFFNNKFFQDIFYERPYTKTGRSWTLEQRFFCFYKVLLEQTKKVDFFENKEVCLITVNDTRFSETKKVFPIVTHYILGRSKVPFMQDTKQLLEKIGFNK